LVAEQPNTNKFFEKTKKNKTKGLRMKSLREMACLSLARERERKSEIIGAMKIIYIRILVSVNLWFGELYKLQSFFFEIEKKAGVLINFEILMQLVVKSVVVTLPEFFGRAKLIRKACMASLLPEFSVEPN
jgi:hypothetical protein